jgi:uncharacterized membrane protein
LLSEKSIHKAFEVSLWLKAAHSALEILGGLALWLVSNVTVLHLAEALTRGELMEDPQDRLANALLRGAHSVSTDAQSFAAFYLLSHGVVKLFLVGAVLQNKAWAYPVFMATLVGLIVYQSYRLTHSMSYLLLAITVLDAAVLVMAWHEYRHLEARKPAGRASIGA